jgi:glycosyltransferase involved in cell wall biosynthesis
MRIAVDLRALLEPFESGVSVYTRGMLAELAKSKGVDLDLFYQARKRYGRLHKEFPGVRHVKISTFWHRLRSVFWWRKLPDGYFKRKPDLIWLPDRREFYRTEIPVAMTVHDLVPEKCGRTLSLKGRLLHGVFGLKRLMRFCDGILVPSSSTGASLKKFLPAEVKMAVTYEGVELARCEERPDLLKKFEKTPFFLAISPADPRKRLDWVLEMAREFPKVNFVIAGVKKKEKRFSRYSMKCFGKQKNIFVLGRISEEEKLWLLRRTNALLALSMYEGFDLPVLEAAKAKCPVIMSDIAVHRELYHSEGACFVEGRVALRAAIARALHGNVGSPKPRGDYTWERAAQEALLLFRRVIHNKN